MREMTGGGFVPSWLTWLFVCACCALLPLPAAAKTQLEWDAPAACPTRAAVRSSIERALGQPFESTRLAPMGITAGVTLDGSKFRLALTIKTPGGTSREELFADECALFVRVIALKASLAAVPPSANVDLPLQPTAAGSDRPVDRRLSFRTHALLGTSPLPAPAFGVGIGAALQLAPLRFELGLSYWLPRELRYLQQPEVGGEISAWLVDVRACVVVKWAATELAACLGPELALLHGRGQGVESARASDQLAGGVGAGARANVPFGRWIGLWLGLDAQLALNRPEFHVRNLEGRLYRPPQLGTRGMLGVELQWP